MVRAKNKPILGLQGQCDIDLAYPFHHNHSTAEILRHIADFAEQQGLGLEYFADGEAVAALEQKIRVLFGAPAALWFPTGTMAQGIAARLHCQQKGNPRLLLHPTSHLRLHEQDAFEHLHQLRAIKVGEWDRPVVADNLIPEAGCAFVELPQRHSGGILPSWPQLCALKAKAKELDLPLHLDGARIWSCRPYYKNRTYPELTAGFASVYVSLYKDIGAIGGAVLLGSEAFIREAALWRARLGGLTSHHWPMVIDALRLLEPGLAKMISHVQRARQLAAAIDTLQWGTIYPPIPQVNLFHWQLPCTVAVAEQARDAVAADTGVWLGSRFWSFNQTNGCAMEFTAGDKLLVADMDRVSKALSVFAQKLAS